jgi:hypothetical protein
MCHPPLNATALPGSAGEEVGKFRAMTDCRKTADQNADPGLWLAPRTQQGAI